MTDEDIKKLRGVVREEINTALKPVNTDLGEVKSGLKNVKSGLKNVERKLDILWEQVEKVTIDLEDVKDTQGSHTTLLKEINSKVEHNTDNTKRLDRRVRETEKHLGIVPSPESNII